MCLKKLIIVGVLVLTASIVSASECYESSIVSPSPFMGNNGEIFKLANGSIWVVKYEYEYLYEYNPDVIICPSQGKLGINGKMLKVEQLKPEKSTSPKSKSRKAPSSEVIECKIDGAFEGWEGETIVKLTNGQIWQQSEYLLLLPLCLHAESNYLPVWWWI